ncbi:MAG: sugar ABC transporter substrate-binding protein [Cytophagales bacterium]|nr:sugar ABC transporter substrate-binding protein [Cytophagales bacterium]
MKTTITKIMLGMALMAACSSPQTSVEVGFLVDDYDTERWKKDEALFVEKIKELDAKVTVKNAGGRSDLQFTQAKELIEKGVDILVVVPSDANDAARIVDYAHEHKVKVIAYDRLIKNVDLDYYISFDNVKVGELQAEYLTRRRPEGRYAILSGPSTDNNSFLFKLGQLAVLQPLIEKGDIQIVYETFLHDWDEKEAFHIMDQLLGKHQLEVDAILAGNDEIAQGAIKALKKHKMHGKVLVSGQDASIAACKAIIRNEQTMTVYKPLAAIANAAALTAVKLAKNEPLDYVNQSVNNGKIMVPAILLSSMTAVHRQNMTLTIVADNFHNETAIYGNYDKRLLADSQ